MGICFSGSNGFCHQPRADAAGTGVDVTHRTAVCVANTLQVGIPHTLGLIVSVTDVVAYHRCFAAKVTLLAHDLLSFPFQIAYRSFAIAPEHTGTRNWPNPHHCSDMIAKTQDFENP
jgi:hypothetical protein